MLFYRLHRWISQSWPDLPRVINDFILSHIRYTAFDLSGLHVIEPCFFHVLELVAEKPRVIWAVCSPRSPVLRLLKPDSSKRTWVSYLLCGLRRSELNKELNIISTWAHFGYLLIWSQRVIWRKKKKLNMAKHVMINQKKGKSASRKWSHLPRRLETEGCQQSSWLTLRNDVNLASGQYCDQPVESFSPPRFINKAATISHGCIRLKSIMRDLFSITCSQVRYDMCHFNLSGL